MAPRTTAQFEAIRQERSEEILEAALHVFAEEGYHASSVASIAKKAGVSKGLLYNYFESKEKVLVLLMHQLVDHVLEILDMDEAQPEPMDDERFKQVIADSIALSLREPKRWKLFMNLSLQQDVTQILLEGVYERFAPYMSAMTSYFASKGYEDPAAMMRVFNAALDGIQMHCLIDPAHFPADKAKEFLIQQFVER